jgi:altered-inheritance-of-mitochondria protein 13
VNYIADKETSSEVSPQRQAILDAHIRERVQSEVNSLRAQEDSVRQEIERALEKENLDRERGDDDGSTLGDVKASAALMGDLEEIRMKMGKFQSRQALAGSVAAMESGEALTDCYKCVKWFPRSLPLITINQNKHFYPTELLARNEQI